MKQEDIQKFLAASGLPEHLAVQAAQEYDVVGLKRYQEIKELFLSFVRVMATAIEERSLYNANHSRRMAGCGERFLDYLNAQATAAGLPLPFASAHKRELLVSIWLHDVGKITTPLEVMDKAERLSEVQKADIHNRLKIIRLQNRLDYLEGKISAAQRDEVAAQVSQAAAEIDKISKSGFVTEEQLAWLAEVQSRTFTDEDGLVCPWLEPDEYAMLCVRKGTLSAAERQVMEHHVESTDKLLAQIKFSADYANVRSWAAAHHELLDGSGYPKHLTAAEIPPEVRIITILDIFDALIAPDRPYKPAKTVAEALQILQTMAEDEGKLDAELVRQFAASHCWEDGGQEATIVSLIE